MPSVELRFARAVKALVGETVPPSYGPVPRSPDGPAPILSLGRSQLIGYDHPAGLFAAAQKVAVVTFGISAVLTALIYDSAGRRTWACAMA